MAQNDLDQPVFMDDNSTISPPPAKRSRLSSCQQLGFKGPLLQYLKKNANPKLLLKLMQCSKYFCYKEFPFMVIKDVKLENNNLFYHRLGKDNSYHKMVFHKISKPLWIVTPISIAPMRKLKLYYRLLSKAAVCDIDNIQLVNQTLYFEKFKRLILSKKIRIFIFQNSYFTNDKNGGCDSIDEILKAFLQMQCRERPFVSSYRKKIFLSMVCLSHKVVDFSSFIFQFILFLSA